MQPTIILGLPFPEIISHQDEGTAWIRYLSPYIKLKLLN